MACKVATQAKQSKYKKYVRQSPFNSNVGVYDDVLSWLHSSMLIVCQPVRHIDVVSWLFLTVSNFLVYRINGQGIKILLHIHLCCSNCDLRLYLFTIFTSVHLKIS